MFPKKYSVSLYISLGENESNLQVKTVKAEIPKEERKKALDKDNGRKTGGEMNSDPLAGREDADQYSEENRGEKKEILQKLQKE